MKPERKYYVEKPKQVIVVRRDLKMGKGKMCAQVAHASLKAILDYARQKMDLGRVSYMFEADGPIVTWLNNGRYTKICVYVDTEKELDMLYESAVMNDIPCAMIVDNGLTEFKGILTKTCVGIGPDYESKIDKITGQLKLV